MGEILKRVWGRVFLNYKLGSFATMLSGCMGNKKQLFELKLDPSFVGLT
jgi:hypothetical protein